MSKDSEEESGGSVLGAAICGVLLLLILCFAAPALIVLPFDRCGCGKCLHPLFGPARWLVEQSDLYSRYVVWQYDQLGIHWSPLDTGVLP